jgi:hypothetical protein
MTTHRLFLALALTCAPVAALAAQPNPSARPADTAAAPVDERNAHETRERLREILQQYPPSVGQVLRLDPSLLTRPEYMSPYPTLNTFVLQHPEIAHNPEFFLGGYLSELHDVRSQSPVAAAIQEIFVGFEVMLGMMFGIGVVGWLLRSAIDYRRWQRAIRIQTEAHTKIVDRLASNEDLLAYIQSPAGQRVLNPPAMATASIEASAPPLGAPINRILWSVQAGVVLAVAGAGLWLAKAGIVDEAGQAMQVMAVLVMALGIGFVLSAVASYLLSRQLGLVTSRVDHA